LFKRHSGQVRFGIASEIDFLDYHEFAGFIEEMRKVYDAYKNNYRLGEREIVFSSEDTGLSESSLKPFIMLEKIYNERLKWQIIKAAIDIFEGRCQFDLRGIHYYKVSWSEDRKEVRITWRLF